MIKVANAPCSWGVLEFDLAGESAGYAQVLDEIDATGYAGTELGDWGFMPTDPKQLRHEIHSRGLTLLGAFVPVMLKDPNAHARRHRSGRPHQRVSWQKRKVTQPSSSWQMIIGKIRNARRTPDASYLSKV